jgi:serine/threonine protein kinase
LFTFNERISDLIAKSRPNSIPKVDELAPNAMLLDSRGITISNDQSQLAWMKIQEHTKKIQEWCFKGDLEGPGESTSSSTSQLSWDAINVESLLGSGAFCDVYKVRVSQAPYETSWYALKCINERSMRKFDDTDYLSNVANLAIEAAILSRLQHKNIITVRGTNSVADPKASRGYFILMDVLEETLADRFEKTRKSRNIFSASMGARSILFRIQSFAIGICDGMKYLHDKNIILRDLKPANIGFDRKGTVKLFDFGLARHTDDCDFAIAGSLRYMAPETVLCQGSDKRSDIYSFALILYEIATLKRPYNRLTHKSKFIEKVVHDHYRPSFRSALPSRTLVRLITACWNQDRVTRPPFSLICGELQQSVAELKTVARLDLHILPRVPRVTGMNNKMLQEEQLSSLRNTHMVRSLSLHTHMSDVTEEATPIGEHSTSSNRRRNGSFLHRSMGSFHKKRGNSFRSESSATNDGLPGVPRVAGMKMLQEQLSSSCEPMRTVALPSHIFDVAEEGTPIRVDSNSSIATSSCSRRTNGSFLHRSLGSFRRGDSFLGETSARTDGIASSKSSNSLSRFSLLPTTKPKSRVGRQISI